MDALSELITIEDDDVVCDGNGVVIQRRNGNASDFFYRDWAAYKEGFGHPQTNFWWGLEKIHTLTSQRSFQVQFEFTHNNWSYYARYSTFYVAGESDNYRLSISGYSGNAGDGMKIYNNMMFTTKDRDNDELPVENCATEFGGAWWYNRCHVALFDGALKIWRQAGFMENVPRWADMAGSFFKNTYCFGLESTQITMRPL